MKRSVIETILGAVVLLVAGIFLVFSYDTANVGDVDGYEVSANFTDIGGLKIGDSVLIGGYKVGSISNISLTEDYLARVSMSIDSEVKLPLDTGAVISSQSLLGGRYLGLEPGAEEEFLKSGDSIEFTQSAQNLEQLLGQFVFSQQNSGEDS